MQDKIKIFSLDWELVHDEKLVAIHSAQGLCVAEQYKIYVNPKQTKEQLHLTLIHETLHALLHSLGYTDLYDDEKLVNGLSEGLNIAYNMELKRW